MKSNIFDKVVLLLQNLKQQGISYTLAHHRDEAIMVTVAVPGERWEVEFLSDGSVNIEKFISNGEIAGEKVISELFARYSEQTDFAVESLVELQTKVSLRQIAALPIKERHKLLAQSVAATAEDFLNDPNLTEFSVLDGEDWDTGIDILPTLSETL